MRIASWRVKGTLICYRTIDRSPRGRHARTEDVIPKIMKLKPASSIARVRSASVNIFSAPRFDRPSIPHFGVFHRSSQQFSCTHRIETSRSQTYVERTLSRRRSPSHPPHPSSPASRSIHIDPSRFVSRVGRWNLLVASFRLCFRTQRTQQNHG